MFLLYRRTFVGVRRAHDLRGESNILLPTDVVSTGKSPIMKLVLRVLSLVRLRCAPQMLIGVPVR